MAPENFLKQLLCCCAGLLGYSAAGPVAFQVRGALGWEMGRSKASMWNSGAFSVNEENEGNVNEENT